MNDFKEKILELDKKVQEQNLIENLEKENNEYELAKKNHDFFMVFKTSGSPLLRELVEISPIGIKLFLFLAENADRTNALIASGKALSMALGVSEASVSRAIKTLIDKKLIEKFQSGGSNVFVLNPEVVWSAWKTGKSHCLFGNAKVLISKNEQDKITRKKLSVVLEKLPNNQ
jgi:DNA-binding MarR family transcriptional regulator